MKILSIVHRCKSLLTKNPLKNVSRFGWQVENETFCSNHSDQEIQLLAGQLFKGRVLLKEFNRFINR